MEGAFCVPDANGSANGSLEETVRIAEGTI
jgi:hypothetical protein